MRGEKGFALVIALIVTTLLVALLAEFVNEVYVDTSHSHNFVASQQAGVLAESGIEGGRKLLELSSLQRGSEQYSSPLEVWAKPQSFETENGTLTVIIEEESGKLNLNWVVLPTGIETAFTPITRKLFENLKLSNSGTDLTSALMDWIDEGDVGAAETGYYRSLTPPYAAKNAPLETVEELALVKGFTPEVVAKLKPCVTVYGDIQKINVNTASKDVLLAIGLSQDKVDSILDTRKARPIKSLAEFDIAPDVQIRLNCQGSIYRIHAEGKVGESIAVAEAVIDLTQSITGPKVLYWREY
ncbi:type II secretion system minor pseudopilin GspK [Geomonas azotofigens]|uniref:type II secretion system minor pseudopilin GspK n=1 Tax=Geomonas azotofigens TaxID=2843196 RepID=UPI001C10D77F|nr:type II secretion system minor pseudopilin GspK [Geomonas azotofigens]MBU5614268.1 type II secretion system minor pseudopilin GspK [Geomonas azotofigens]